MPIRSRRLLEAERRDLKAHPEPATGIRRFGYRFRKKIFFFCVRTSRSCQTPGQLEYFVALRQLVSE